MWILFALATPAFYSVTNFVDKFLIDRKITSPIFLTAMGGLIASVIGFGLILFHDPVSFSVSQLLVLLAAGILLNFYQLPYFKAIKIDEVSRVVPMFQFIPVFALFTGWIFLGETLSQTQILGVLLVTIGGFVLAAEEIESGLFRLRPALGYMLLAGLLYSLVGLLFRSVVTTRGFWDTLAYEYVGMGIGDAPARMALSSGRRIEGAVS